MLRLGLIAGAAALAFAAPVSAQTYNPTEVKMSVNTEDMKAVVQSLGHELLNEDAESTTVIARSDDGVAYFLFGTACDVNGVPGCQGIMMQVRYDITPTVTNETLAKANFEQAAINTWADFSDGTLGVTRYQVLDYGATMANIRENLNVLLALAPIAASIATGEEN